MTRSSCALVIAHYCMLIFLLPFKPLPAAGPETSAPSPTGDTVILANDSYLTGFLAFRTPVVISQDGKLTSPLEPVAKDPKPIPDFQSPLPPAGWANPEFDDFSWDRYRTPVEVAPSGATGNSHAARHSATVSSVIYLRGKFLVEDPARVTDLRLSLEYVGGVIVFLNGQEIIRGHLPAGEIRPATVAEKYPDNLYCEPRGLFLQDPQKNPTGFEKRYRKLTSVAVPAKALQKGINILALELHRSPINEAAVAAKRVSVGGMYVVPGIWSYVGLKNIRLTSSPHSGIVPNVGRPSGIQVWTVRPADTLTVFDHCEPCNQRPVCITGVRNGVFSGRLIVSSNEAIKRLKISVSDLKTGSGSGGIMAGSIIKVRYAEPAVPAKSWAPNYRFDGLVDSIPDEIPVVKVPPPREDHLGQSIKRPDLSAGAVASIWLTLGVPRDAKPGKYEAHITVQAEGLKAINVPLQVTIHDWLLPDPKDFRMRNMILVSQEAIANHYGVPLWSNRHFQLMGKSLVLMAEINSRMVPINLALDFYGLAGNSESMVRWIKQPDGSYKYDFTVFDKYLDLVAKTIGKPLPLRLNCWGEWSRQDAKQGWTGPSAVTLLDPVQGTLERLPQPPADSPEFIAFWKPVLDEVRKKIKDRGWSDVAALGHNSYCYHPTPVILRAAGKLWPDGVWSYTAHNGVLAGHFATPDMDISMPVRFADCVWTEGHLEARGYRKLIKPRDNVWCDLVRSRHHDHSPLRIIADIPEELIMRGHDGLGDSGADFFPLTNPKTNRFYCLANGRGTGGPNVSQKAMLAPGPDGPIVTERFEAYREGMQICEAILFLQRALEEGKISGGLQEKVNRYLDERAEAFIKHWPSGRLERTEKIFSLVAEVAAAIGEKSPK